MEELNTVDAVVEEVVTPQIEEVETEVVENVESEVVTDTQEEVKKVVQTPEENAKFADQRRKLEADKAKAVSSAKDDLIAEMYGESHGIKTVKEYEAAMAKQEEQAAITAIQEEKNYSEEDAKELLEARQIKAAKAEQEAKSQKTEKQKAIENQQNIEFLDYFKSEKGREYDPKQDKIATEVWDSVKNNTPLKYAYMEYELKQLKLGTTVADLNAENAEAAIGSVNGDGAKIDGPLTAEQVDNMSMTERMARWPEVKKVMGMV
jgi:hypothetical protein